uniref:Cysteine-rich receptor-like protein kinase 25 n=1 Tax=Aegilops tauschii subsp. strangulata TaxID=200361 RepID=A0A453A173_AEGTS
ALSVLIVAFALLAPGGHAAGEPWHVCGDSGEYDDKSVYQANLNLVAAALPKNASASPNLFATAEAGAVPEKVTALALCRGDANSRACSSCLANAFANLPNVCPGFKEAVIYYDACMLRYSDVQFLSADDSGPLGVELTYTVRNDANATSEPGRYQRAVATLMNATADYAAYNSTRRYATGQADLDREFPKVYSWAQCTPDLTPGRCRDCLAQLIAQLPVQFTDSIGGRLLGPRCSFEYETKPFINGPVIVQLPATSASSGAPAPAVVPTPPASATAEGRKYSVPGMVLIILLPMIAAINLVAWLFSWRRRQVLRKAKQPDPNYSTDEAEGMESVESMLIDISTLRAATEDFAESNKLGEGGFGPVYKGTLLSGDEIAVKRLSKSSTQGVEELKNELALVAKLKHKNLVRLIGICLEQQERLLIYEFIPNRSLDLILFDEEKRQKLDWETRYKIINGVARGLQYLHEDSQLKVVHRDLKASNVLLDMNMNPKISDFGLAKIFGRDQTQGVTNRVVGTYGYMAPEYVMRGNYSVKSDVFSFGVLVLEIVMGRKNSDCYNSHQSQDLLTTVRACYLNM